MGEFSGEISHEVDRSGLEVGDRVHCILDWERRYKLMRSHTAAHVLASVLCSETEASITDNELGIEKTRFDFSLENFDREAFKNYISKVNEILKIGVPVRWYELPRSEAMKILGVIKMAEAMPPDIPVLRIVEIEGIDVQADGGTHVRNLQEVGQIEFLKAENKGEKQQTRLFSAHLTIETDECTLSY